LPRDRFGLTVTTPSARALSLYAEAVDRILSANAGAEALLTEAVALDPGFALAHVALARNAQLYGRMDEARSAAARAAACIAGASERERRHVEALTFSINVDAAKAMAAVEAHVRADPRDGSAPRSPTARARHGVYDCGRVGIAALTKSAPPRSRALPDFQQIFYAIGPPLTLFP